MSVKIQINSLEALERLIGGDTELELELRSNVVDAFTKKHLVKIANLDMVKKAEKSVLLIINDMFCKTTNDGRWNTSTVLKPELVEKLKKDLEEKANGELEQLVLDSLKIKEANKKIDKMINDASERITDKLIDKLMEQRIDSMVNAKLKQQLGL